MYYVSWARQKRLRRGRKMVWAFKSTGKHEETLTNEDFEGNGEKERETQCEEPGFDILKHYVLLESQDKAPATRRDGVNFTPREST